MVERGLVPTLGWLLLSVAIVQGSTAQERPDTTRTQTPDTSQVPETRPDTTIADSLRRDAQPARPDQSQRGPTDAGRPGGDARGNGSSPQQSSAVTFSATDSLVIRSDDTSSDRGTLYGEANTSYEQASLQARTIELNFKTATLEAKGSPSDTIQGGRPVFQQGGGQQGETQQAGTQQRGGGSSGGSGQSFTGDVLSYNLNTERGRVVSARTQRQEAFIEGTAVKMYEDSTLFVQDGSYTTCDCPPGVTPSYSLRSDEMKVKGKWVYTGSIQLFLFNIPTPLWLPFGILPNVEGRRSGPLSPDYGEDRRGFFLKNWGWYFALDAYTDLTLQASVWSKGSFEFRPRFRYRKRYNYDGDIRLTYRRTQIGEEEDPNFQNRQEGELEWAHSQDLSPTSRLHGNINLATSGDFAQRNSDSFEEAVQQDISSNISYNKNWPEGGRQFNVSARQQQQLQSGEVRMTLPNLSFSQNSFKPFKREQRVGEEAWYEKMTTSYQLDVTNSYNFTPRDPDRLRQQGDSTLADSVEQADVDWYEALVDRDKYQLATGNDELYDFQTTHRIPLRMSFRVDRYNLSLSPNIRYSSEWYISTVRRIARRDSTGGVGEIVEQTKPGFYARREFSTSFSAGTELFGTFPISLGPFEGLRHRLSPSLSANYQPNFNAPLWGRTRPLRFEDGTVVPRDSLNQPSRYDILSGSPIRNSTEQRSLSFSLSNVFETKRVRTDSTGERQTSKVRLLNVDISGLSYNFAADSFQVGRRINLNARTRIDPFNVSMRSSFSPYALERVQESGTVLCRAAPPSLRRDRDEYVPRGPIRAQDAGACPIGRQRNSQVMLREVDRLMIAENPLTPARLTQFRASLSADFSSDDGGSSLEQRGSRRTRRSQRTQGGQASSRSQQRGQQDPSQTASSTTLSEFSVPWSLNVDLNYSFSKSQKEITNRSATLSADFSLNVTPLWRIQGNTGYDFIDEKVSTTRIRINRNLGCWNMSFSWVPFGRFQQFSFNLQVSSGHLSQLLRLQIPNEGGDGRFGGFGSQLRNTAQGAAGLQGGGRRGGRRGRGGFP